MLSVHLRDQSGREFGGKFRAEAFSVKNGRLLVDLEYCGTKGNKKITFAWIDIDPALVQTMARAIADSSTAAVDK